MNGAPGTWTGWAWPVRNRWAWGPTYLGPGKRSVTRATGHTVTHTLHLRHSSDEYPTASSEASMISSAIVMVARSPALRHAQPGPR